MKFDAKKAQHDYITDNSMSYRKLAEKYEVNYSTVQTYALKHKWVEKRKKYQSKLAQKSVEKTLDKQSEKLSILSSATEKTIEYVNRCFKRYESEEDKSIDITILKDIANTLKTLTSVQRDLNGILTVQEEATLSIAKERLQLERDKKSFENEESGETGIVIIPAVTTEESQNTVYEEESNA